MQPVNAYNAGFSTLLCHLIGYEISLGGVVWAIIYMNCLGFLVARKDAHSSRDDGVSLFRYMIESYKLHW